MSSTPLVQDLAPIEASLNSLFLDPNNPRFVDANWTPVPDDEIDKQDVQETAQRRLVRDFDVEKLRMNMEVNGYLPIDRVVVREFQQGKYVLLEGNRRICAAKMISPLALDGSQVTAEVLASLETIPCLQYTGLETDASWIFQGLRHIVGVVEWSAFNKAKLLVEQMEKEGLSLGQVGKRFGLTSHGAGQWVRGYSAFNQARANSDYINEVDERSYPFFQELFGRTSAPIREWLGWDETEYKFDNLLNFNEFIGWLYPKSRDADGEDVRKGDWERRRLVRRDDLRTLSFLHTSSPDHFMQFRNGVELDRAYSAALAKQIEDEDKRNLNILDEVFDSINVCTKMLRNVPFRAMKHDETRGKILSALTPLETAIQELKS